MTARTAAARYTARRYSEQPLCMRFVGGLHPSWKKDVVSMRVLWWCLFMGTGQWRCDQNVLHVQGNLGWITPFKYNSDIHDDSLKIGSSLERRVISITSSSIRVMETENSLINTMSAIYTHLTSGYEPTYFCCVTTLIRLYPVSQARSYDVTT